MQLKRDLKHYQNLAHVQPCMYLPQRNVCIANTCIVVYATHTSLQVLLYVTHLKILAKCERQRRIRKPNRFFVQRNKSRIF